MDTKLLKPDDKNKDALLKEAAAIIRSGGLLGIPTETVYGLGADGLNPRAVTNIFLAKGRPQDNPLILHVPDVSWLERYCHDIPDLAYELADLFWPGPLTMILPKKDTVPSETAAGLDTVGIRCPANDLTREIIRLADRPVAAPSANISGKPSCTTAEAVMEDFSGRIDAVIDDGPCGIGVESTVIDMTVTPPQILRPGGMPAETLEAVIGSISVDKAATRTLKADETPRSPGMKYRHYAPKAPVTAFTGEADATARAIKEALSEGCGIICFEEYIPLFDGFPVQTLGQSHDALAHARHIFSALRAFDHLPVTRILAQCPGPDGLDFAVSNRLKKAAGFHIIEV